MAGAEHQHVFGPEGCWCGAKEADRAKPPFEFPAPEGFRWLCHTKVAGISFDNDDGSSRQRIAAACSVGERLLLLAEPENRFDPSAVKIVRRNGQQLGHLNERLAGDLHAQLDGCIAVVTEVTGGTRSHPTHGVNLLVGVRDAAAAA